MKFNNTNCNCNNCTNSQICKFKSEIDNVSNYIRNETDLPQFICTMECPHYENKNKGVVLR